MQRGGHGKDIFERMLMVEGVEPRKLAYDRPSPKLRGFLAKHYNLKNFVPQNNNYVVFDDYFANEAS
jgi:alpha-tubulin N-acetyltransferase 1